MSPDEILTAFDELARIWGPPPPRPPQTTEEVRAEEMAMRRVDEIEARNYFDGQSLDMREERVVRGWVGRSAA